MDAPAAMAEELPRDHEPHEPFLRAMHAPAQVGASLRRTLLCAALLAATAAAAAIFAPAVSASLHSPRLRAKRATQLFDDGADAAWRARAGPKLKTQRRSLGNRRSQPRKAACSPPAKESFHLPHKGCPVHDSTASCLANNTEYRTFAEAWAECGARAECGVVMRWTNGLFYLRRLSDPDRPTKGAGSTLYSCEAADKATRQLVRLQVPAHVHAPAEEACAPPPARFDLPQKGCPNDNSVSSCLANNADYASFAEAWAACGTLSECSFVMRWTSGKYYLRRASDPDGSVEGAASMLYYSCRAWAEEEEQEATAASTTSAAAQGEASAAAAAAPAGALADPCGYATFEDAWAACASLSECGVVSRWKEDGRYHLMPSSDSDVPMQRAASTPSSCAEQEAVEGAAPEAAAEPRLALAGPAPAAGACSPPAEAFHLPQKGCPSSGCVGNNADFATFEEAWEICGTLSECGVVMRWKDRFYLRRQSDPDIPMDGAASMVFSCAEQPATATAGEAS